MTIDQSITRNFPTLAAWLQAEVPKSRHNPKIFDAFVKFTGLTIKQSDNALRYIGSYPEIDVKVMKRRTDGVYDPRKRRLQDKVFLNRRLCRKWEKLDPDVRTNGFWDKVMLAAVLHEMVHWGDLKADGKQSGDGEYFDPAHNKYKTGDLGFMFESEAFYAIYSSRLLDLD